MKLFTVILLLFLAFYTPVSAQDKTATISGSVVDAATLDPVEMAGIRILNAKDSSYVSGAASNKSGKFNIRVNRGKYILQTSFLGYTDRFIEINANKSQINVGSIKMSDDGILLNEAVIIAKAPEIVMKGDTVEYTADIYNVQETAVLEDLIKKIPGAEISDDGKITINGKDISKILVDGKEFFSNDPTIASKNLPAKMIDKLQVLDKKSEMAQMTGFDDGDEETVINLTVKPGMKEGVFGNAMVGYGSKDRYEGSGMINYMRNNSQLTGLFGLNNTNNAGFTDFASNMSGSGGPPRGVTFGRNNGVAKTGNAGLNFATEKGNTFKINGDFRYGTIDNDVNSTSNKTYTGVNRTENSTSWGNNKSDNFGANMYLEWKPDSMTQLIFRPQFQYNKNRKLQSSETAYYLNDSIANNYDETAFYSSDGDGINLSGDLWFNRKLNSKGRSFTVRLAGGYGNTDTDGFNYSKTSFFNSSSQDSILDQRFTQKDNNYNWRVRISYVEPLGRNNFMELAYNIRNTHSEMDKATYSKSDPTSDLYDIIDNDYTRNVKSDFLNQNITLSFRSERKNFNYTLGVGLEPSRTKTTIEEPTETRKSPTKNYLNFAPRARFNYIWSKRQTLRIDYRGSANSPTALQLFDGLISQSGYNKTIGNPDLRPSFENRVFIRYQKYNPEQASSVMFFGRFTHTSNDIVTITKFEDLGRTTTYANVNGNWNGNGRFIFNLPLRNKKFSINSMTFASYQRSNTLINEDNSNNYLKNKADIYRLHESAGIRFRTDLMPTRPDIFTLELNGRGNISFNSINNSISKNSNKNTYDYGGYFDFTLGLPWNLRIDSDITYSANSGYGDGFKRNEWLWNASVSKDIFKAKNGTIRFKIYDILQERSNISRNNTSTYIEDITTNTLNSYFMVNFVYRFQIFKGGAKASDIQQGPRGYGPPHRRM